MKNKSFLVALVLIIITSACKDKDSSYKATIDELLITSISPSSGIKKDIVIITGRNFSTNPQENIVKFNGVEAIVLEGSKTRLEVVVPENATTGEITVTVKGEEVQGPKFSFTSAVSNYIVNTVAGNTSYGFVDGNNSEARFRNPDGVLIDLQGNIIVTDRTNHSIRKVTPNGDVTTIAGNGIAGFSNTQPGQFKFPWQSTIDAEGNIIVVEKDGARIRKIETDGTLSTIAGTGSQGFLDGPLLTAKFNNPLDAVVDTEGNIFVADRNNYRVRKINLSTGQVSTFAGDGTTSVFKFPIALTIDKQNNLYVSDANTIKMVTPSGTVSTIIGSTKGFDDGEAGNPLTIKLGDIFGLNFDNDGNLLLADASNNRIRKVTPGAGNDWTKASISTIAGTGSAGRIDGLGNAATFNQPYDVVVDPAGDIYVADNISNSIRRIVYR